MLADLALHDSSFQDTASSVFSNTFSKAKYLGTGYTSREAPFVGEYYDDEAWWALAWMRAFQVTKNNDYLDVAKNVWLDMVYNGATTPSGGTWRSKEKTAVNSIANELLFAVSAHLAVFFPDDRYYTPWANYIWQWLEVSGTIDGDNLIVGGLNLDMCKKGYLQSNNGAIFTYTQGVILDALIQLSTVNTDASLIARAKTLADAALQHFGLNILGEPQCDPSYTGDAV